MKFTTYLMLPLCLLQGLSLNGLMSGTMALGDMTGGSFDSSVVGASIMALVTYYSLYAVLYLLGTVMLTSLVYALVRTYNEREERLEGVTLGMLKPLLFRNVRRVFLIMIIGVLLVLFVGLIVGFIDDQVTKMNITVVGKYAGANYEYTRELTILKSSDTVIYELIPSADSVIIDNQGNMSAQSISCDIWATSSDDKRYKLTELPAGYHLKHGTTDTPDTDIEIYTISYWQPIPARSNWPGQALFIGKCTMPPHASSPTGSRSSD